MGSPAFRFFHDQLPDDRQRAFYDIVETCIRLRKDQIVFPRVMTMDEVDYMRILEHVYDDHPEFFSFFPLRSAISFENILVKVVPFYRYSARVQSKYDAELERAVERILRQCFPSGWESVPELNREKIIFDWITRNVVYDDASYKLVGTPRIEAQTRSVAWNAYGALVRRTAVCEGIACAFKLLCDRVNLPSIVVLGRTPPGRHAWNMVRINKKFYHVDCTWDLRSSISTQIPYKRYQYFNLPDKVISTTHTAESCFLPVCGSLQYNPFKIRGLCANQPEDLERIALQLADKGEDRFAIMAVGFLAKDYGQSVAQALANHISGEVNYYTDDGGHFIGFVITKRRGVGRR